MNKYHAIKTTVDGITFDSRAEARRYRELKLLERAGAIENLVLQPKFELQPKYKIGKRCERAIIYRADFQYWDNGKSCLVVEDVKGVETKDFKLKKKLFEYKYQTEVTLVKG